MQLTMNQLDTQRPFWLFEKRMAHRSGPSEISIFHITYIMADRNDKDERYSANGMAFRH